MTDEEALEAFLNRQLPTTIDTQIAASRLEAAEEILDELGNINLDYKNGINHAVVEFVDDLQRRLEKHRAGDPHSGWRISQAQLIWLESIRERIS